MATPKRSRRGKVRGHIAIPRSLDPVVQETFRLWRKHHLGYDQTKYVVERIRRRLGLKPPLMRNRTVARLEQSEVQRLIQTTYRNQSKYGLMIKTLFQSGARVAEFVHIRVEDLLLDGDPPQIHIIHAITIDRESNRSTEEWVNQRMGFSTALASARLSLLPSLAIWLSTFQASSFRLASWAVLSFVGDGLIPLAFVATTPAS